MADGDKQTRRRRQTDFSKVSLSLEQWAKRTIEPKRFLLGEVFSTTTRAILSADTGLGKTHFGFAVEFTMAAGQGFCHWAGHGSAPRILVIDGEMSSELVKERLVDAERRIGRRPDSFFCLCREDVPDMPPLDTEVALDWLGHLIAHLGGIDFIIFDNISALTQGNLAEPESWLPMRAFNRSLTRQRLGVLWINHTGHDKSRDYGPRMRLWDMDVAMLAQKIDDAEADIAFTLEFVKARQRKPTNRSDFETVEIKLSCDQWTSSTTDRKKLNGRRQPQGYCRALEVLDNLLVNAELVTPAQNLTGIRAVQIAVWRNALVSEGILEANGKGALESTQRTRLSNIKRHGIDTGAMRFANGWVWRPSANEQG